LTTVDVGQSPDCFYHCILCWLKFYEVINIPNRPSDCTPVGLRKFIADRLARFPHKYFPLDNASWMAACDEITEYQPDIRVTDYAGYISAVRKNLFGDAFEIAVLLDAFRIVRMHLVSTHTHTHTTHTHHTRVSIGIRIPRNMIMLLLRTMGPLMAQLSALL